MIRSAIDAEYDVVLYGATGFTGRQTVEYFARHAPPTLRWAIAGRDRARLDAVRAPIGGPANATAVLVADSRDQAAVDAMVGRTRVLLTTAGPFSRYGTPIVDACARLGTHYADITGEAPWLREVIDRYHDRAAAGGTRIIPGCGFDSVPSDLGTFLVARHARSALGEGCREVRGYFRMKGGLNGGTIATALEMAKAPRRPGLGDPFLLGPPGSPPPSARQVERSRDPRAPHYDADIGAWVGPFVMAGINTRVVRRSAALFAQWQEPYGTDFVYQEQAKYSPPNARARAILTTAGLGAFNAALRRPLARWMLERFLPRPGEGPSLDVMERGWFSCELLGFTESGRRVRGLFSDRGDPGNRATVKMLCESALALALNTDELPGGRSRGGVLTPATGLGHVLADRLRTAGMTIDVAAIDAG
jgi:short subunit dehydrogenase-like uncharacterized protein